MEWNFKRENFMAHMEATFYGMENCMMRGMIDNLIDFALLHMRNSESQFCKWLSDMIPELTFQEVADYLEGACLDPAADLDDPAVVPVIKLNAVRKGVKMGVIQFITDPNAEHGTVCEIGENWFYFGGETAENEDPEEFLKNANQDEVIMSVFEVLEGFRKDAVSQTEYAYYSYYLKERGCFEE